MRRRRQLDRVRTTPRDDHTRRENLGTQPLREHPVFDNPSVVAEGWYPLVRSRDLRPGEATSTTIARQRLAVWRGEDGLPRCVDAFCPHMGADLGNGIVRGDELACYFHRWTFDGDGHLASVPHGDCPAVHTRAWATTEDYGWIWAWAGDGPRHPLPRPPGLEGHDVVAHTLGTVRLFAHHHVMMAGGIDVQHFASVHGLTADFDVRTEVRDDGTADWHMTGRLPTEGWRGRMGRRLLGDTFSYTARFAGGSVVTLTYGPDARLGGHGRPLPAAHILWGARPHADGVSEVAISLVAPAGAGLSGAAIARARLLATAGLLAILRDDDVLAFPHMRFQVGHLVPLDASVAKLVRFLDDQPVSPWAGLPESP